MTSKIPVLLIASFVVATSVQAFAQGAGGSGAGAGGSGSSGSGVGSSASSPGTGSSATSNSGTSATTNKSTNYFAPGAPATNIGTQNGRNVTNGVAEPTSTPQTQSSSNSSQQPDPAAKSNNTLAAEQNAAVNGTKTVPTNPSSGTVSAPGVGVGTAANGLPIGSSGSKLGSPEHPIDSGSR